MAFIDRIKERTGTDVSDTELTAMINGIVAELDARFGPVGPIVVHLGDFTDPNSRMLMTHRVHRAIDAAQPVTITEIWPANQRGANETVLTADDYRLLAGGRTIQRLTSGPNGSPYWAPMVQVEYTPIGEEAARDEAIIKLVQLDLSYRGALKSERAGDYQFTLSGDVTADREAIMASLQNRRGMVMA